MAKPIRPLERLPMKRTGSMGSAVPPARDDDVPAREVRGAARCPSAAGGPDGSGCRTGRSRTAAGDGIDEERQLDEPTHAHLAGGQGTGRRIDDRVAELPQRRDVGPVAGCAYMSPSMAGATTTGALVARQVAVMMSSARPFGHGRQPARRGRRDEDGVGRVRRHDVADAAVGLELQRVEHDRPAGERLHRERADEMRGRAAHHDLDLGARAGQRAQQLGRLVGGDRAGHAEEDEAPVERAVGSRAHLHAGRGREVRGEEAEAPEQELGVQDVRDGGKARPGGSSQAASGPTPPLRARRSRPRARVADRPAGPACG